MNPPNQPGFTLKQIKDAMVERKEMTEPQESDYDWGYYAGFNKALDAQSSVPLEFYGREHLAKVIYEIDQKSLYIDDKLAMSRAHKKADAILAEMNANPAEYLKVVKP